jgi:hypothetical protein
MLLTFASVNTLSISGARRCGECSDDLVKTISTSKSLTTETAIGVEENPADDKTDIVN